MNPPPQDTRKAAIYLRISQDREMDGLAIDRQREDCENLAAYRRWDVVEIYVDQSVSATDKTKVRPAYTRMVTDYEADRFSAIICYDLDRLTRQPRELEDWIDRAESHGLALVTANGDADLSTDGGRMYARIKAAVARAEMERKSARQSRAQKQRAEQGRAPKGVRPLGYSVDGDVIEKEAHAVRAIYSSFVSGGTLRGIARALSGTPEDGRSQIPTVTKHTRTLALERNAKRVAEGLEPRPVPADTPWDPSSVLGILRNPRYAGYSAYTPTKARRQARLENRARVEAGGPYRGKRKDWRQFIVTDEAGQPIMGQWESLIDVETWHTVQAILDDPSRATTTNIARTHLGSGIYRCGVDGCENRVRSANLGGKTGYRCKTKGHVNRTAEAIDTFVQAVIAERLRQPDVLETVPGSEGPRFTEIIGEIDIQHARIARAERDYDEELIEAADLKRIRDQSKQKIDTLETEKLTLAHGATTVPLLSTDDPATTFLEADLDTRRAVITALCTVTLHKARQGKKGFDPSSVTIEWN